MNTRARKVRKTMQDRNIDCRVHELDWERIGSDLEAHGSAVIETLLMPVECDALAALYSKDEIFRSRVVMAGMVSDGESTSISATRFPRSFRICALRSIPSWFRSPIAGMEQWVRTCSTRRSTLILSNAATRQASFARLHYCCSITQGITIVCTKICTGNMYFPFSSPSCYLNRAVILRAASLY